MSLAKVKARQVLERLHIDSPEILDHLEEICWELGVVVRKTPMLGSEARITMKDEIGIISVSADEKYSSRVRFSIAHELGHFLMHQDSESALLCGEKEFSCWFSKNALFLRESEANEFAAELLLPKFLMEPLIVSKKPTFELVSEIAEKFKMSLTATALRLVALSKEAIALVAYNKSKGVLWSSRSKLFEEQGYWIELGKLNSYMLAYDAIQGTNSGKMESVDATTWFEVKPWLKDEMIKEQTKYSDKLDFGLSILWIDNGKLIWN